MASTWVTTNKYETHVLNTHAILKACISAACDLKVDLTVKSIYGPTELSADINENFSPIDADMDLVIKVK